LQPKPPSLDWSGYARSRSRLAVQREAERELAEILADEPGWVEKLEIVVVDFSGAEAATSSSLRSEGLTFVGIAT
jgi:hypothetical protein